MTKNREIRTIKYKVDRKYQIKANKKIKRKVNHDNKEKKKTKSTSRKALAHVKIVNLNPFSEIQINSRYNHTHR